MSFQLQLQAIKPPLLNCSMGKAGHPFIHKFKVRLSWRQREMSLSGAVSIYNRCFTSSKSVSVDGGPVRKTSIVVEESPLNSISAKLLGHLFPLPPTLPGRFCYSDDEPKADRQLVQLCNRHRISRDLDCHIKRPGIEKPKVRVW